LGSDGIMTEEQAGYRDGDHDDRARENTDMPDQLVAASFATAHHIEAS
jgi:hypothetical protein